MVVFTCNNCGDSVQKPRAVKHISIECKKKYAAVSLCCVDCLNDFNADTFGNHTKCVSELERYSGGNFVAKQSSNKGERKQNSWIDTVRSVLDQPILSNQQRQLLKAISQFENVPRKKAKFQNFIRSSIRSIRVYPDVVESVFNLLEQAFKSSVTPAPAFVDTNSNSKKNIHNSNNKPIEKLENAINIEKKVISDACDEIGDKNLDEVRQKKLKKEINKITATENESLEVDEQQTNKKNKRKRMLETESEGNVTDEKNDVTSCDTNCDNHSKKRKKQQEVVNGVFEDKTETESSTNGNQPVDVNGNKKKSRKQKSNENQKILVNEESEENQKKERNEEYMGTAEGEEISINGATVENGNAELDQIELVKFDWEEAIKSILLKATNRETSVKKVHKKVAKKYQKFLQVDKPFEDIVRRFNKRVKKIPNVYIKGDVIRLCE